MAVERSDLKTISFEGPATIYEVSAHRETLREALAERKNLRIDLGDSGKWDVAGLQLLISCVRTAERHGLTVRLARVPRVCAEIAERSGLSAWLDAVSD
ncbi:MAG: lipid asymmetry maintenance protein MlaB [Isosphaeraceae bacterium]